MTRPDYTHITVILDSSGSMGSIKTDTIGGFNAFLKGQQKVEGKATLTQVHFSSGRLDLHKPSVPVLRQPPPFGVLPASPVVPLTFGQPQPFAVPSVGSYGVDPYAVLNDFSDIQAVAELNNDTFVPGGGTPLLDSIARGIEETGAKLAAMPEDQRPSKVLFVIITDGQENQSTKHNKKSLFDMIKHQQDLYKWTFLYLGANQDAMAEAGSFGISSAFASNYGTDGASVTSNYRMLNAKVGSFRAAANHADATASISYSAADKLAVMTGTVGVDGNICTPGQTGTEVKLDDSGTTTGG